MILVKHLVTVVIYGTCFLHQITLANDPIVIKAAVAQEFKDGLHSRYLRYIARQLDMEINIVTMPLARRIVEVQKGNLDLIVGLQYSQIRANELIFIFPAYELLSFRFFALNDNAIKINNYDDLEGKTIGVIRGAKYYPAFEQDRVLQKYPLKDLQANVDMLLHGRIDVFVHYEESTIPMLKMMAVDHLIKKINYQPTHSHEHYLAISKNSSLASKKSQLVAIVERGLQQQDFMQLRLEHYQKAKH